MLGVEELWTGISFDPVEETLSWEASCQVNAVISLCELQDQGVCQDLANSSQRYVKGMVSSCIQNHNIKHKKQKQNIKASEKIRAM